MGVLASMSLRSDPIGVTIPWLPDAPLPVSLSNTLDLVLLLDGVGVGGTLGGVGELLSEALSNGFDVAECGVAGTGGQEVDGGVDTTKWGDIDGLTTHDTGRTDTARVLTGAGVHDGIHDHLDGVLAGGEGDDVTGVLHDAHSKDLLAVVAAVHHERVGDTLDDGALGLLEALLVPAAGRVGQEARTLGLARDVVREGHVLDLHVIESVLVEELDLCSSHFVCWVIC